MALNYDTESLSGSTLNYVNSLTDLGLSGGGGSNIEALYLLNNSRDGRISERRGRG